jgi:hypothetical protein
MGEFYGDSQDLRRPRNKGNAFDTKDTRKKIGSDTLFRLDQPVPRNTMSYSGADFTTLIHVPVANALNGWQVAIDEIQDEIWELENILLKMKVQRDRLLSRANTPSGLRMIQSIEKRALSTEERIKSLERIQEDLRKRKGNIIPRKLDTLQTLSVQVHVDKQPVRALGHSYPKGYTRGAKLVAGSMIFTVIKEHPLIKVIDTVNSGREFQSILPNFPDKAPHNGYDMFPTSATSDHLPPMHMTILGVNEAGNAVNLNLYGVEFINDGTVLSIQDLITETTISFVAQDIDIMRTLDTRGVLNIPAISRAVTVSSFLTSPVAAARRARRGLPF